VGAGTGTGTAVGAGLGRGDGVGADLGVGVGVGSADVRGEVGVGAGAGTDAGGCVTTLRIGDSIDMTPERSGHRRAAREVASSLRAGDVGMVRVSESLEIPVAASCGTGMVFASASGCERGGVVAGASAGVSRDVARVGRPREVFRTVGDAVPSRVTVTLSVSERPRFPAPSYATASNLCSPAVAVRESQSNFTAPLLNRASGVPSRSRSIRAIPDSSKASTAIGTAPCASMGAISSTLGGVRSFATTITRREEIVRPSRRVARA
jgi:hypothetical protein